MLASVDQILETTLQYHGFNAFLVVVLLIGLWFIIKSFLEHLKHQETEHKKERETAQSEFTTALGKVVDDSREDKAALRKEAAEEHAQMISLFADLRDRIHCTRQPPYGDNSAHNRHTGQL